MAPRAPRKTKQPKKKASGQQRGRSASTRANSNERRSQRRGSSSGPAKKRYPQRKSQERAQAPSEAEGILKVLSDGSAILKPDQGDEIFIPSGNTANLASGDRVKALLRVGRKGRVKGEVIALIHPGNTPVIGVTFKQGEQVWVKPYPDGPAAKLKPGVKVDNAQVIRFSIDPAQRLGETHGKKDGPADKIYDAELVDTLGPAADIKTMLKLRLDDHNLPNRFEPDVLAQVKAFEEVDGDKALATEPLRKDLRKLKHVTIDGEDAKDFDDAVVAKVEGKNIRVWVSIADVASYVSSGSPLDVEALNRSTSVYFPRHVIPMLPERISNGLCSLRPNIERLAMTCVFDVKPDGQTHYVDLHPSVIVSHARLTYSQVTRHFEGRGQQAKADQALWPSLEALRDASRRIRKTRQNAGALDLDLPEPHVVTDEEGRPVHIRSRVRLEAHRIIEDLMIAANEVVARYCLENNIGALFRVHEPPTGDGLELFTKWARRQRLRFKAADLQTPKNFATILDQLKAAEVQNRGEQSADDVNISASLALRALSQARYDPSNLGHFGLASSAYLHFTSPIRRYPDLQVHRALWSFWQKKKTSGADLAKLATECSTKERRAMKAERDVLRWISCVVASEYVGHCFAAVVVGVADFGLFLRPRELFIEGVLPIAGLLPHQAYFEYVPEEMALVDARGGYRYQMGDVLNVRLVSADESAARVEFALEEVLERKQARAGFEKMRAERGSSRRDRPGSKNRPRQDKSGDRRKKRGPTKRRTKS